jgi:Flp pilus assembly pilin Flp
MQWILARLREDSTRAAIGQLGLLAALLAVAMGADVGTLLTQAEAYGARIVALLGVVAAVGVQVQRIVTADPRPPETAALSKVAEIARAMSRQ